MFVLNVSPAFISSLYMLEIKSILLVGEEYSSLKAFQDLWRQFNTEKNALFTDILEEIAEDNFTEKY